MLASRRVWLGVVITGGFLLLLFWRVDFSEMRAAFANANYAYLIPGIAVYFASLYFRSFRWRFLLAPFAKLKTSRLYPVVMVGYMANNLLPMRLGELARSYYLSVREPVRGSTALATIVVERVFDGLVMLFFLAIAAFFLPLTGFTERVAESVRMAEWLLAVIVVAPFVVVLGLIVIMALYPAPFQAVLLNLSRYLPERIGMRAYSLAARFIAGFQGLHRPSRLISVFLLSLPIWLAEGVMYYIVGLGFDLHGQLGGLGPMAPAILLFTAVANLATSIPSSQGSVGPFEFFSALALIFMGVSDGTASAYVIVLHIALLLPVIVVGFAYLATQSLSLGQIVRVQRPEKPVPAGAAPNLRRPDPHREELP